MMDPMEEDDDKKQDKVQEGGEDGTRVEDEEISVQEEVIQVVSDHDRIANIPREIVDMLEPVLKKNMEDVIEAVTKLQIQQKEKKPEEKFETKEVEESNENANDANLVLLQIKSCRTINELCIYAGLTPYRDEKQLVCDLCDEANESSIRKAGEFHYDFTAEGVDFTDTNLPNKFRDLKKHIVQHIGSNNHKEAENKQKEQDKNDKSMEIYNQKVGMKLVKMIYSNIKERNSYTKYERDVANAASNGE